MKANEMVVDNSPANLLRSVDNVLAALDGKKRLDLFQCARVDHNYPIEETIKELKGFVEQGKFDHIGLSEVSADTLRRANSVSRFYCFIYIAIECFTGERRSMA